MARQRSTTHKSFQSKENGPRALTSERIAHDLQAFQSSGGRIEMLSVTRVLKKLDEASIQAVTTEAAPDATGQPQPTTPTSRVTTSKRAP